MYFYYANTADGLKQMGVQFWAEKTKMHTNQGSTKRSLGANNDLTYIQNEALIDVVLLWHSLQSSKSQ